MHTETRRRAAKLPSAAEREMFGSAESNYTNFVESLPAERQRYSPIYLHSTGIHYGQFPSPVVLPPFRAKTNVSRSRLPIRGRYGGPHRSLPRAHLSFLTPTHQALVRTYSSALPPRSSLTPSVFVGVQRDRTQEAEEVPRQSRDEEDPGVQRADPGASWSRLAWGRCARGLEEHGASLLLVVDTG